MTGTRLSGVDTTRTNATHSTAQRAFTRAATTAGALTFLAACGDTIYNTHYHGQDAATDGGTCASGPNLVCGDAPVQEYIRKGQTLDVGNVHFKVEDLGVEGNSQFVVLSFQDPDCNTIKKNKVYVNQPMELSSPFGNYTVTLSATYTPDGGTPGAILKIEATCSETVDGCSTSGVAAAGFVNQGEDLIVGSVRFRLDDIANQADGVYALLSVIQGDNTLTNLKIKEGNIAMVAVDGQTYVVNVIQVAPGYTFGAKWVDLEVSICNIE